MNTNTMSAEQQMLLNINRYTVEEVAKKFTRKEIAQALVASTCYDETISQQYDEFKTKENMIAYLMNWLDECLEDAGTVEDIVEFINTNQ